MGCLAREPLLNPTDPSGVDYAGSVGTRAEAPRGQGPLVAGEVYKMRFWGPENRE